MLGGWGIVATIKTPVRTKLVPSILLASCWNRLKLVLWDRVIAELGVMVVKVEIDLDLPCSK